MKRMFVLSAMACMVMGTAVGQTLTNKASLKKLHPAFRGANGMTANYTSSNIIAFKFNEEESYVIEFGGITITMNKVRIGDEKIPKKVKVETPKYEEKKVIAQDAVCIKNDVFVIARHEDKKTDKVTILSYKADLNGMSLASTGKILDSYTEQKGERYTYAYRTIDDALLVTRSVKNKKEDYGKMFFLMYDKNMNKLWESEIKAPDEKAYAVDDYYFKDEDNLLLTCVEYPDGPRRAKKKGKPNYKYHLFYYTNKMKSVKDYEIELADKFITDISSAINDKGQVVTSGFYSDKGSYSLSGCFYMRIDSETKKVEKTSMKEFDNAFNLSLMNKRQQRKAKKKVDAGEDIDAPQFDLRDLYFDDKGNVLLIAEDYYVLQHCSTNSKTGTTTCYYTYHYDDLIAVSINSEGEIVWNTKIDKKLTFSGPVHESFVTINEKAKWVFIYNENLKNLKDAEDEDGDDSRDVSAGRKNSAPVIVVLDEKGNYTKEVLMMPEGKKSIMADHDFHLVLNNGAHVIKITDPDGSFYYRLDLKL